MSLVVGITTLMSSAHKQKVIIDNTIDIRIRFLIRAVDFILQTKKSNVASEGDQTLCNYKGVFLKSYRQIAVIFFPIFWSFSEFIARIAKLRIFSYIMYKSIVCY